MFSLLFLQCPLFSLPFIKGENGGIVPALPKHRMKQTGRHWKSRMMWLLILLIVSGCAVISTSPDFCAVYKPVATLHCGSEFQKLAVDQNNAVYGEFCED